MYPATFSDSRRGARTGRPPATTQPERLVWQRNATQLYSLTGAPHALTATGMRPKTTSLLCYNNLLRRPSAHNNQHALEFGLACANKKSSSGDSRDSATSTAHAAHPRAGQKLHQCAQYEGNGICLLLAACSSCSLRPHGCDRPGRHLSLL